MNRIATLDQVINATLLNQHFDRRVRRLGSIEAARDWVHTKLDNHKTRYALIISPLPSSDFWESAGSFDTEAEALERVDALNPHKYQLNVVDEGKYPSREV